MFCRPSDEDPDTWLLDGPTRRLLQSVNDELAGRIGCAPGCTAPVSVRGSPAHIMTAAEVRANVACLATLCVATRRAASVASHVLFCGQPCASWNDSMGECPLSQVIMRTAAIDSSDSDATHQVSKSHPQVAELPVSEFNALWREYVAAFGDLIRQADHDARSAAAMHLVCHRKHPVRLILSLCVCLSQDNARQHHLCDRWMFDNNFNSSACAC